MHGWAMSQELRVNDFKWVEEPSEFDEKFIKSYNNKSDEGYIFKVDVQYSESVHNVHNYFLLERMKIEKSLKTCSKLSW